jgi:hypothetical protein
MSKTVSTAISPEAMIALAIEMGVPAELATATVRAHLTETVRSKTEEHLIEKGVAEEHAEEFAAFLFDVSEKVSEIVPVTAPAANAGNKNTKAYRYMIGDVPVPMGRIEIHLYLDSAPVESEDEE